VFGCRGRPRPDSDARWSAGRGRPAVLVWVCAVSALCAPGAHAAAAGAGGAGTSVAPGCPPPTAAPSRAVPAPGAGAPLGSPPMAAAPAATPDARVSTGDQLVAALCAAKRYIWIENSARIDLAMVRPMEPDCPSPTDVISRGGPDAQHCSVLRIPDGVTLASGRSATADGALLFLDHQIAQRFMLDLGSHTRVTGLRLRGDDVSDAKGVPGDFSSGIEIGGQYFVVGPDGNPVGDNKPVLVDGVVVDNNEVWGWPNTGIGVTAAGNTRDTADHIRITGNYVHNQVSCAGGGYGVGVGGGYVPSAKAYAYIDGNLFDYNRHSVAGDGVGQTGYIADRNFLLYDQLPCQGSFNQHFDMHGTVSGYGGQGGEYEEIRWNTIRGDQHYGASCFIVCVGGDTRRAFQLRGPPRLGAVFSDNVLTHPDLGAAVKIDPSVDQSKLTLSPNRYGTNTGGQLAVGDFDGDGRTDVFQATGAGWWYSGTGRAPWRFLNQATRTLDQVRLGDFNGDGRTDVFTQVGDTWFSSSGGTGPFRPRPAGSNIPMSQYAFVPSFDGGRETDIFRTNGKAWYYSAGAASAWRALLDSRLTLSQLRFGDFNGDGRTDVLTAGGGGQWRVSWGGRTQPRPLNRRPMSAGLGGLVFADFNGDGRTDIARSHGGRWEVSWGGRTGWRVLRAHAPEPLSQEMVGRFRGKRRANVLLVTQWRAPDGYRFYWRLWSWQGGPVVRWSKTYTR